jgi:hypothetical protein
LMSQKPPPEGRGGEARAHQGLSRLAKDCSPWAHMHKIPCVYYGALATGRPIDGQVSPNPIKLQGFAWFARRYVCPSIGRHNKMAFYDLNRP